MADQKRYFVGDKVEVDVDAAEGSRVGTIAHIDETRDEATVQTTAGEVVVPVEKLRDPEL